MIDLEGKVAFRQKRRPANVTQVLDVLDGLEEDEEVDVHQFCRANSGKWQSGVRYL